MIFSFGHVLGAFLFPLTVAAANSSSTSEGLLSNDNVDLGAWQTAYTQAKALVAKLSNNEKITLVTGGDVTSANWTALQFKDGTMGVQGYDYVTGFGETSALVNTWDKTLMFNQFKAVAAEFYGKGFQVTNAPTTQPLGRSPWGGRLVEALGQDSYLNGIAFGLGTKAFSETGIVPGGKHFLLNEQETNRQSGMSSNSSIAPYSSVADDKTLHETYLWSWYDGAKEGMGAVMCAMTKVNETLSCENEDLLQKFLKTELGFPGMVFPDVNGQSTAFGSANGGLDYGSSSIWSNTTLLAGISNGTFTQARLDDMAIRNVIGYFYVNLNNGTQPAHVSTDADVDVRGNHSQIVRSNGAASLVLLKNTNNALPLKKPKIMAIFGSSAGPIMAGPNYVLTVTGVASTYAGHLAGGSGSGQQSFPYLITPQAALTNRAAQDGTMIRWILNDTYTATSISFLGRRSFDSNTYSAMESKRQMGGGGMGGGGPPGGGGGMGMSGGTSLQQTIPTYAESASVCLVFINAWSGEGADRTELRNTGQDALVNSVASECNNTVVVVNTVGARILDTWIENENVTAVVYGGLLGQESGNSLMDVLYGDVNPSGKLTYTIAKNESDYIPLCTTHVCNFTEGNFIDYKYFDKYNITPRYEFGYGLSYTTFNYTNMKISVTNATALASKYPTGNLAVGGKEDLWYEAVQVSVDVQNNGTLDGNEVSQLYLQFPAEADAPIRQLRGFERTMITTGSIETVTFGIKRRDLSYWDVAAQEWALPSGDFVFSVGASSRDLRLSATQSVLGANATVIANTTRTSSSDFGIATTSAGVRMNVARGLVIGLLVLFGFAFF